MISKREREPSSSFEGSEEDQRERRRAFDIELILWGTNSDHSGDSSPPESVTTREITKLEILVVAAERSSVLVLARALQSLAVSVGLFVMSQDGDGDSLTDSGGEEERLSERELNALLKTERHGVRLMANFIALITATPSVLR